MGDRVREVERSMEVARLHQAFSANVRQQVEQLEAVYANSVRTMGHLERGNVQLRVQLKGGERRPARLRQRPGNAPLSLSLSLPRGSIQVNRLLFFFGNRLEE